MSSTPEAAIGHEAAALTRHLRDHPEVHEALDAVHALAWTAVDARLLEVCRLRMASLIGATTTVDPTRVDAGTAAELAAWPSSSAFSAAERACLAFAEQFVIDVATMPDDIATAVVDALGADGAMNFVNALLVVEQRLRLAAMWSTLFGDTADDRDHPVDHAGGSGQ